MATRDYRLSEFTSDQSPPADTPVQVLCEDHVGTYLLPFYCIWREGGWHNPKTGEQIQVPVIGWRMEQRRMFERAPVEKSG